MYNLEILEYPIILQCNLACDNCNSFSNFKIQGKRTTLQEFSEDVDNWKNIVNPKRFSILGGEPLLHKDIEKILIKAKEAFPKSSLYLITNGLLLKNNKNLLKVIQNTDCRLVISVHCNESWYLKELYSSIEEFFDYNLPKNKPTKSNISFGKLFEISNVKLELRNMNVNWTRLYKEGVKPYNDDPELSHKICRWAKCTQLYKGNLWKCSSIAFLKELLEKINNKEDWEPYLKMYNPLNYSDSVSIKDNWFSSLLKPENICSMCSSNPEKINNKNINMRLS
jgi:organic radical activating enzyme